MSTDMQTFVTRDAPGRVARILVVEDERVVARSLRTQLTTLGYDVVGNVSSGEEAVKTTSDLLPDLVLMDINLEGTMDGVEAAAVIGKQFRLPVVYLTAYSNSEILERAMVTEPFGYILKPYEARELHVVIETALYKHRMERRQQDRERWFVATLRSIGDAVVASNDDGRVAYMNPLAERLTGWSSDDALGRPFAEVVSLTDAVSKSPTELPILEEAPRSAVLPEVRLTSKDRTAKVVEGCVSLITDEEGSAAGRVVVLRDVTERKRQEKKSGDERKLEAVGRLAGGVAHTFNNLMTVVLGHSELLLSGLERSDPLYASALAIEQAATRTAALTQNLLAFGQTQTLASTTVDVNVLLNEVAQIIRDLQVGVQLDLVLQPGVVAIETDRDQLAEAILTLARSACKAMSEGGRLTIETGAVSLGQEYAEAHPEIRPGGYVLLAISDTAPSLSAEATSHLFEPFHNRPLQERDAFGLAAVYGFVKQCAGHIEVVARPGQGTTFRLYLPRREGARDAAD